MKRKKITDLIRVVFCEEKSWKKLIIVTCSTFMIVDVNVSFEGLTELIKVIVRRAKGKSWNWSITGLEVGNRSKKTDLGPSSNGQFRDVCMCRHHYRVTSYNHMTVFSDTCTMYISDNGCDGVLIKSNLFKSVSRLGLDLVKTATAIRAARRLIPRRATRTATDTSTQTQRKLRS